MAIDLYLYDIFKKDKLFKLSCLNIDDAKKYAHKWFKLKDTHDYMLVIEGSTPWVTSPTILDVEPNWLDEQKDILERNANG